MISKNCVVKIAAAVALSFASVQAMAEVFTLKVTAASGKLSFDGDVTPVVNVEVGDSVVFDLSDASMSSHPFYVTEKADNGKAFAGAVATAAAKTLTLKIDANTPKELFYSCKRHARMGGTGSIQVLN